MPTPETVTFVISANNAEILKNNFLESPLLAEPNRHQVILQQDFKSAAEAYNDAIARSQNDLMVFAHQDVYFPAGWLSQVESAIAQIERSGARWGVLGCFGATADRQFRGYLYSSAQGLQGQPLDFPAPVQTLDEFVLIMRKSSGLLFDPYLPHFHLYGADICLRAKQRGLNSYAISAPCIHNTQQNLVLPREFYECCAHVQESWKEYLPIQTTCIRLTRFRRYVYERQLRELHLRYVRKELIGGKRSATVKPLVREFESLTLS